MDIVPDTAGASLATQLTTTIGDNIVGILGVMFLAISVKLVLSWLKKASKVKA